MIKGWECKPVRTTVMEPDTIFLMHFIPQCNVKNYFAIMMMMPLVFIMTSTIVFIDKTMAYRPRLIFLHSYQPWRILLTPTKKPQRCKIKQEIQEALRRKMTKGRGEDDEQGGCQSWCVVDDLEDGQGGHDDEKGGLLIVTCCSWCWRWPMTRGIKEGVTMSGR